MNKVKLWIPVLVGLMIGQLFAEGERPFKVVNTLRFGYNDNLYRNGNDTASTFVTDTIDLSFRASLSDRTDLMVKSQFNLLTDDGGSELYPNLYAMLNHSVSPRLLLRLSEYYRSGEKSGSVGAANKNERYNYYENRADIMADYVLTAKDRLQGSAGYDILRHEDDEKDNLDLDTTTVNAGVSWLRELAPQRTRSMVNLNQRWVEYDHRDSSFQATDLSAGLSHTFNQEWQGSLEGGTTYVQPDYPAPASSDSSFIPLVRAGLVYSPSPRTRLTGDFGYMYTASDDSHYGGQTTTELRFGAQHDITAKIMAKATARFSNTVYDQNDNETPGNKATNEDRMDLDLRLTYKLNRINYLELGVRHSEKTRDTGEDWQQNVVDVGWRVELN